MSSLGAAQAYRLYGQTLSAIAEETEDVELKEMFRTDGEASVEWADAFARGEGLWSGAGTRHADAQTAWDRLCKEANEKDS